MASENTVLEEKRRTVSMSESAWGVGDNRDAVTPAIDCQGLVKSFGAGAIRALDDVSLAIKPNEFFTLLGPSGCGKTTLLRSIAGFETPDVGSISVFGERIEGLPPYKRPINTVFQSYAVFPHMTVEQNVSFGLEMKGYPKSKIQPRVREVLSLVRLEGMEKRKPSQLSGGQQQRVAFARALAPEPRVLLLDEPLSALDQKLRTGMQIELKRLQREVGITFIFVTHDQHEALTMSDRIAVMSGGRILQIGPPEEIYERPKVRFVADFIGETNFLDAQCIAPGRYRLSSGHELAAPEGGPVGETVALAVRPERTVLSEAGPDALGATVNDVVYEGMNTTYYVTLDQGARVRICEQNRLSNRSRYGMGARVGVSFPADAIRVLPS